MPLEPPIGGEVYWEFDGVHAQVQLGAQHPAAPSCVRMLVVFLASQSDISAKTSTESIHRWGYACLSVLISTSTPERSNVPTVFPSLILTTVFQHLKCPIHSRRVPWELEWTVLLGVCFWQNCTILPHTPAFRVCHRFGIKYFQFFPNQSKAGNSEYF